MTEIELVQDIGVTLIDASASDDMVAMAAWVSHDADSEERLKDAPRVESLINFLYRERHMSPFEHGHLTFKVDAPLFVAREFFRHRTASYNEVSGRYTEMKPRFYIGRSARVQHGKPGDYYFAPGTTEQTAVYIQSKRKALDVAWKSYTERLEAGIAKEQAREELPLSLMTQFYVTMNPRNLMQFLTLRNEKHALKEIQDVAVQMERHFQRTMPLTYNAYAKARDAKGESQAQHKLDSERITELETALTETKAREASLKTNLDYFKKSAQARSEKLEKYIMKYSEKSEEMADLKKNYDELNAKYNREFVARKEDAQARDYQTDAKSQARAETVTSNYVNEVDWSKLGEKIAPVYNVYVDVKHGDTSLEELPGKIIEALKKTQRRMK